MLYYYMTTLVNLFGRIWMRGNGPLNADREVNPKLVELESDNTSVQKKYNELTEVDRELDNGYNPLFYAVLFLSDQPVETSWLTRLIRIAESIEGSYPDLRRTLFSTKDHEDKTILMLLIEFERDDSEARGDDIRLDNIRFLLQKYRAVGATDEIEEAQQFCDNEGIELQLNTLGGKTRRVKKTRKSRKYKKKRVLTLRKYKK
jgi:hypothetical protein